MDLADKIAHVLFKNGYMEHGNWLMLVKREPQDRRGCFTCQTLRGWTESQLAIRIRQLLRKKPRRAPAPRRRPINPVPNRK